MTLSRPGYGAPRNSLQKENLMKMLHFQDVTQVLDLMLRNHDHNEDADEKVDDRYAGSQPHWAGHTGETSSCLIKKPKSGSPTHLPLLKSDGNPGKLSDNNLSQICVDRSESQTQWMFQSIIYQTYLCKYLSVLNLWFSLISVPSYKNNRNTIKCKIDLKKHAHVLLVKTCCLKVYIVLQSAD